MSPLASSTSFSHPNTLVSPSFSTINDPLHHRYHRVTVLVNSSIAVSFRRGLTAKKRGRERLIACEVALKPDSETSDTSSSSISSAASAAAVDDEESSGARIGARVRVKVPLKVYHVPKVPEIDLTGMDGKLKQYVGLWKGKRISANLPFKVEFITEIEGRGPVKFLAHLKEDEFDYVDDNRD